MCFFILKEIVVKKINKEKVRCEIVGIKKKEKVKS